MRRPDPKEPHGTESNKKQNFPFVWQKTHCAQWLVEPVSL
jgi:hypothetical protein